MTKIGFGKVLTTLLLCAALCLGLGVGAYAAGGRFALRRELEDLRHGGRHARPA